MTETAGRDLQPHVNAATIINRMARRGNRHPETKAALLLAERMLLNANLIVEWTVIHDGEPWLLPWSESEEEVRSYPLKPGDQVMSRIRVETPDVVEDWRDRA